MNISNCSHFANISFGLGQLLAIVGHPLDATRDEIIAFAQQIGAPVLTTFKVKIMTDAELVSNCHAS